MRALGISCVGGSTKNFMLNFGHFRQFLANFVLLSLVSATTFSVVSAQHRQDEQLNKPEQRVETSTPMVFSNHNVNLNNVGLDDSEQHLEDLGPKLQGPNVCTKQEP
jgi:hypothetical protein